MAGMAAAFVAWISAIAYALADPRSRPLPKVLLAFLLVLFNVLAAVCYYFFFVLWKVRRNDGRESARALESPLQRRARKTLAVCSWILLLIVVVLFIAQKGGTVPHPAELPLPFVRFVAMLFQALSGVCAIVGWAAALTYAVADEQRHLLPKPVIVTLLLLLNVLGAVFFYFLFVRRWTREARQVATLEDGRLATSG
jgi:hypothetical protein